MISNRTIFIFILFSFLIQPSFSNTKQENLKEPPQLAIFWDASFSMRNRNLNQELVLLENIFKNEKSIENVQLVVFNTAIISNEHYQISNSNWQNLRDKLENITYDGVASYEILPITEEPSFSIVFTDGIALLDSKGVKLPKSTFLVSSVTETKSKKKKGKIEVTKFTTLHLSDNSVKDILKKMNIEVTTYISNLPEISNIDKLGKTSNVAASQKKVYGVVYSEEGILQGASIAIKGSDIGTTTNDNGQFELVVLQGDVLEISYAGKQTKQISIQDNTQLEITLSTFDNELEEVTVTSEVTKTKEQEAKEKRERIGYEVRTVESDNLNKAATDVAMSIQGRVSGVKMGQNDDISQMVLRANSMLLNIFPLILVDGTPVRRSSSVGKIEVTNFIDPNNIHDIKILKGLAATNRWGSEGANGVIMITTKTSLAGEKYVPNQKNSAMLKDNNFNEKVTFYSSKIETPYMQELEKQSNVRDAYNLYINQRENYLEDPLYFIHVADYMFTIGNYELASIIASNTVELFPEDIDFYSLFAFKSEEYGNLLLAKILYQKLIEIYPSSTQYYRNLAMLYQDLGEYQKAVSIYTKIINRGYGDLNFSEILKTVESDVKRLSLLHGDKVNMSTIPAYLKPKKTLDYDARLYFEWSTSTSEFDLQFVDPQNKFFTWSHTQSTNASRLKTEEQFGFSSEEFLLIDSEKGEWLINLEPLIKKKSKPVAIKYTVYSDFATLNEVKRTYVFLLNDMKEKQTIDAIIIK